VSLLEALERPAFLTEHFTRVSAAMGYKIDPPEAMVDLIGHVALGRDTTAALQLFEMNTRLYPTSANAVASLADVWLAKKDTTKALGYYEKALAMRPGLKKPKDMLQKLKKGP